MRRNVSEASYDEASRARWRRGPLGPGDVEPRDPDHVLTTTRNGFLVLFGVVSLRLLWLQVFQHGSLTEEAESHRTNVFTLYAKRGTLYDRNGNVLAMSVECYDVYCNPKDVSNPSGAATICHEVLGGEYKDYLDIITEDTTFAYLQRKVDSDVVAKLKERLSKKDIVGIYYLENTKRVYPYGGTAGQVLGAVGSEGQGLTGLELQYDDILTGTDGQMIMETGLGGTPIAGGTQQVDEARNGTDLVLGIDVNVQAKAEEALAQAVQTYHADSGSALVMDPKTGEIICACSTPYADVSDLSTVETEGLTLKLVASQFEPGSVFKVLTTSIGIELGLFDAETVMAIPVTTMVGDDEVTDDDARDYTMDMTVREMMRRSSNVAMATLVQNVIGAKAFSEGVNGFGIGHKTGIDYPGEIAGTVKGYDEYDGSTAGSMAFGQGVAIPMIQIARAYACVANRGTLVTPHFVVMKGEEEVSWPTKDGPISSETAIEETDIMRTVMQEGTGQNGQVPGFDVAGKTGTGEQAADDGSYRASYYVASLCGFANADDPQVLVYVGLNGVPHLASQSAALLFADVMSEALADLGVTPVS